MEITPRRPNTPTDEALEAAEMLINVTMTLLAIAQPDPEGFLQASRNSALKAFTSDGPMVDPRRQRIADHMDWMLATAEGSLRAAKRAQ